MICANNARQLFIYIVKTWEQKLRKTKRKMKTNGKINIHTVKSGAAYTNSMAASGAAAGGFGASPPNHPRVNPENQPLPEEDAGAAGVGGFALIPGASAAPPQQALSQGKRWR